MSIKAVQPMAAVTDLTEWKMMVQTPTTLSLRRDYSHEGSYRTKPCSALSCQLRVPIEVKILTAFS